MGFKESYLNKIEDELKRCDFDLESLKTSVEREGLGNMPEWLNDFSKLRDKIGEVRFHLSLIRRKHNSRAIHIAKLHIAVLLSELKSELAEASLHYRRF